MNQLSIETAARPRIVDGVNRRQRKRKGKLRAQHAIATRTRDFPAILMSGENLPRVDQGHIVPRMYQRAWEGDRREVAVHDVGQDDCESRSTKSVGIRPAFYRRIRPEGVETDDFEATLAGIEGRAAKPLREVIGGESLTLERKGALAQFLAFQLMRSPTFFDAYSSITEEVVDDLEASNFRRSFLRSVEGDLERAKAGLEANFQRKTPALIAMVSAAMKVADIMAHMRWHVLRFDGPLLAYSDQPVVLWPMNIEMTKAFTTPHKGPLGSLEIRAPLAPNVAVLMNWSAPSDLNSVSMGSYAAGDLNAFTVGQADREWMHKPGIKPEVPDDIFRPLSRLVDPNYNRAAALGSTRRRLAQASFDRMRSRTWINEIEVLTEELGGRAA